MYLILILILFVNFCTVNGRLQKVTISGRFICLTRPVQFLNVKLKEGDILNDQLLNTTKTNKNGYFTISGEDDEYLPITPFIETTFTCCLPGIKCKPRTERFDIPFSISAFFNNEHHYRLGEIELLGVSSSGMLIGYPYSDGHGK